MYQMWAKSNNPRLSYWRFCTLARFRRPVLRRDIYRQTVLRRAWAELYQILGRHRSKALGEVVLHLRYPAAFQHAGGENASGDGKLMPKFTLVASPCYCFHMWKSMEGWARCLSWVQNHASLKIRFTYDRTFGIHLIGGLRPLCRRWEPSSSKNRRKNLNSKAQGIPTHLCRAAIAKKL